MNIYLHLVVIQYYGGHIDHRAVNCSISGQKNDALLLITLFHQLLSFFNWFYCQAVKFTIGRLYFQFDIDKQTLNDELGIVVIV